MGIRPTNNWTNFFINKAAHLYLGTFGESFKETINDELLKQIFAVTVLDNEVKNGGFDSFFYNSADLHSSAFEGLKIIGAHEHADLCRQAIEIYQGSNSEFKNQIQGGVAFFAGGALY